MEPIISKLQEGVKYPRFERDATKTINDLVEHITKERGVYSSSIEPNPNEHNIWFNTNDNTLYIYNKGVWKAVSDKDTDILNEPIVFYCSSGTLYYYGDNEQRGTIGFNISGFYNKDRLKYIIEEFEGKPIENMSLRYIGIDPEANSTIIIGSQKPYIGQLSILGKDLDSANIYIYNDKLYIGNSYDDTFNLNDITWYSATVYCNCKQIGNIVIMNDSSYDIYINYITFIVGNNNRLTIGDTFCQNIDDCNIYVIKETNNDTSEVFLSDYFETYIYEYVNLCGTPLNGGKGINIPCTYFITTTIDDIDKINTDDNPISMNECEMLIIDASYRTFKYTEFIDYLKTCEYLKVYVTDTQLFDFLKGRGLTPIMVVANNRYFDDKVVVNYKTPDGTDIYNKTIYKQ